MIYYEINNFRIYMLIYSIKIDNLIDKKMIFDLYAWFI